MSRLSAFLATGLLLAAPVAAQEASAPIGALTPVERIMGGVAVPIQEFPWMVSLDHEVEGHFCGGTVIASDWVLTAAHCVDWITPDRMREVGIYSGSASLQGGGALHDIVEIRIHPAYLGHDGQRAWHDLALIRTSRSMGITPVTLSWADLRDEIETPGLDATIIGWGLTPPPHVTVGQGDLTYEEMMAGGPPADWGISAELLGAIVPIQPVEGFCHSQPDGDIVCAGYYDDISDVCQGDSGGPLLVGHRGEYVQIALVSGGPPCYSGGDHYNIYSRVAAYRDWIAQVTNGAVPVPDRDLQPDPQDDSIYSVAFDPWYPATMGSMAITGTMQRTSAIALIGGNFRATELHATCRGWITEIPHYSLNVSDDVAPWLEIELISEADTTLVVVTPEGDIYCDDDSGDGLNAQITLHEPTPGDWAVFAGSYAPVTDWDNPPAATLELRQYAE